MIFYAIVSKIVAIETTRKNLLPHVGFGLTLYGPNSFFRRFLGHNLR